MALDWTELTWDIPLGRPPQVVSLARNVHGLDPVDIYCLPDLWSLHLYAYEADLRVGSHRLPIRPGFLGVTPAGMVTEFHYRGLAAHLYAHFRLDRDSPPPIRRIRAMQDLGGDYEATYRRLEALIGTPPAETARQSAGLWDLLWQISGRGADSASEPEIPVLVRRATDLIERRLGESISVEVLARELGVSSGHLVRQFRAVLGETVIGYVQKRRIERARHLLERSTLPVKVIASAVGIPDLHHFNKAVRRQTGVSPRALRQGPSVGTG